MNTAAEHVTTSRERVLSYLAAQGGSVESPDGRGLTRRIAAATGYDSLAALNAMLVTLERQGLITRDVRGRRTFRVSLVEAPTTRRRRRRPPPATPTPAPPARSGAPPDAAPAGDVGAGAGALRPPGGTGTLPLTVDGPPSGKEQAQERPSGERTGDGERPGEGERPGGVARQVWQRWASVVGRARRAAETTIGEARRRAGAVSPADADADRRAGAGPPVDADAGHPADAAAPADTDVGGPGAAAPPPSEPAVRGTGIGARTGRRWQRQERPLYEVRALDDRWLQPMGSAAVSRHRSAKAALEAMEREQRRFRRGRGRWSSGGYLPRVVVRVDPDGTETIVVRGGAGR